MEKKYDYYGACGILDQVEDYLFENEYLLISEDGENLLTHKKEVACIAKGRYWVSNHAHCIEAADPRLLPYLSLYFNAISLRGYVTGSVQPKLTRKNLEHILIALPPYQEQIRILAKVKAAYQIICRIQQEQEGLRQLVFSAEKMLFPMMLQSCAEGRELNTVTLKEMGDLKRGPFGSLLTKDMFVSDGNNRMKVYVQENAIKKDVSCGDYYISREKYEALKMYDLVPGDIIISCSGTVGEAYLIPENARRGIINQSLLRIRLYNPRYREFFLYYFQYKMKESLQKQGHGSVQKNMPPLAKMKEYKMLLPPSSIQKQLTAKLKEALRKLDTIKKVLD